ncbi:hypothetical protein G9A89_021369 [Geosiphon pyriformis]|nr:hypothetical protein G9A89_021369 [Geosiphon pyriformis]
MTGKRPRNKAEKEIDKTAAQTFRLLSTAIRFEYQVMDFLFNPTTEIRTSTNKNKPKVTKSENIGANHLGFAKSLFQQYSQQLGLNSNHYPAESAFNFYVNDKITECLGGTVNIEAARENFYTELFQHTNLPRNYSFTPIIREINQTIKKYTQQQFPITYVNKGKRRLQTPAVTPKGIQLPTWKKQRIESLSYPSYHYTPENTINISSAVELLGPYELFEEEEEEELEDQEFTYQNLILENPEFETPNIQTQRENPEIEILNIQTPQNQNLEVINQHLPPVIIINQPPVEPIGQLIQTPNQQNQQSSPQQQQMAYAPIAKLDKFTGKENDTQVWLNNVEKAIAANGWNDTRAMQAIPYFFKDIADSWYQSLVDKLQDFNTFKLEFLRYFSNNNSINRLANTFTTIKQEETEAVTTYLGCFHRNLQQIQAIDANYFTAPQIFNQFIHGLYSSILQHVHPLHPAILQDTVTHVRDFESAKLEANHAHAVNLVINRLSELDSKLKQFKDAQTNKPELNQQQPPTNNIPPATVTNDELLAVIFPFELKESSCTPLFSGAALEEKPITAMYTDAKVDEHTIKFILDSGSAGSIITQQLMDQLGHQIDDFPIEINGIIVPIKVLVMNATQYQALVGNDWLSKTNAMLNWTTQELIFSQNGQHM